MKTFGKQKLEELLNKLAAEGRHPTMEELLGLEDLVKEIDELYETILGNQANFSNDTQALVNDYLVYGPDAVYIYHMNNLGRIEYIHYGWITIVKEDWAPGIWAGTEGATIVIGNDSCETSVTITDVDLEERRLKVKLPSGVLLDDDWVIKRFK